MRESGITNARDQFLILKSRVQTCGKVKRGEARMNNHQSLYLVSIQLIFILILALSVLCGKVRLQSTTDK